MLIIYKKSTVHDWAHAHREERSLYTLLRVRLPPPKEWRVRGWYEAAQSSLLAGLNRVGEGVVNVVAASLK